MTRTNSPWGRPPSATKTHWRLISSSNFFHPDCNQFTCSPYLGSKTTKPQFIFVLVLLSLLLTACRNIPAGDAPARPSTAEIQNTTAVIAHTSVARTQTALPSVSTSSTTVVTPPPATLTPPLEVSLWASTLTPPSPTLPPMITPDATQVERWREYQEYFTH